MPLKGRGTASTLEHRFASRRHGEFDDGWGTLDARVAEQREGAGMRRTTVREERSGRILARNDSPDIGFELSINPYRGCEHGCSYCYARPTHGYLDLSPGLDFETRIVAKVDAAERLREALAAPGYLPRSLAIGTVTDAYQPLERRFRITRSLVEVLAEARHAFSLTTKSSLVERDCDLLAPLAADRLVAVYISITTLDAELARRLEPRAAAPHRRLRTLETLARAGVPVGVSVSPLIPFLNEPELERILECACDAGASRAFSTVLRLPWEVSPIFRRWLDEHVPERAARVMARVREMRGGRDNDARFHTRMTGEGVWAQLVRQRLDKACRRLDLSREGFALDLSQFKPPARDARQGRLF